MQISEHTSRNPDDLHTWIKWSLKFDNIQSPVPSPGEYFDSYSWNHSVVLAADIEISVDSYE